jgi:hypothetical protein
MKQATIKGSELLSNQEAEELNKLIEHYREKIKWKTKSDFSLNITIKVHNKNPENKNKRRHYGIHAEVSGETQTFEAIAEDWDFTKVVRMVFDKLLQEIEHSYHSSEQRNSGKKQ